MICPLLTLRNLSFVRCSEISSTFFREWFIVFDVEITMYVGLCSPVWPLFIHCSDHFRKISLIADGTVFLFCLPFLKTKLTSISYFMFFIQEFFCRHILYYIMNFSMPSSFSSYSWSKSLFYPKFQGNYSSIAKDCFFCLFFKCAQLFQVFRFREDYKFIVESCIISPARPAFRFKADWCYYFPDSVVFQVQVDSELDFDSCVSSPC